MSEPAPDTADLPEQASASAGVTPAAARPEAPEAPAEVAAASEAPVQDAAFGELLKAARVAAGLRTADLAERLRLHVRQIEALERSDLGALPAPVYVRGFLRSCARELGVAPEALMAAFDRQVGPARAALPSPAPQEVQLGRLLDSPRLLVFAVVAVLVLAGLIGLILPRLTRPAAPAAPAALAPVAPAAAESAAAGSAGPAQPGSGAAVSPLAASTGAPAAAGALADATADRAAPPAAQSAPAAKLAAPAPVPVPVAPSVPPATAALQPADAGAAALAELSIRPRVASWVEVVQVDGHTLISQLCPPDVTQTVRGRPPLRVVVGHADQVQLEFRGRPVDLRSSLTENSVARLTLE
jgi:cytoskeleton protein RodZ